MLAKLPFRSKLTLVVSVPLLVLLVFAGFAIQGRWEALGTQQQYGHLVGPFQGLAAVARAVGDEGFASEWYVRVRAGDPPASKELIFDARNATDNAIDAFTATLPALDGRVSAETERAVHNVVVRLDGLGGFRGQVDSRSDPGDAFQQIAADSLDAAAAVARDVEDRELSSGLDVVLELRGQQLALSDEAAIVMSRLAGAQSSTINEWITAITQQESKAQEFLERATPEVRVAYARTRADEPLENPARSDSGGDVPASFPELAITPAAYADWYTQQQTRYDEGASAVRRVLDADASARESDTRLETVAVSLGTAGVILLVLLLSWALVKTVNRPLRALTRAAREVSERRLPRLVDTLQRGGDLTPDQLEELTPIKVQSKDEIGELAKAFNTIQHVTMNVAEEQSELLKKGIGDLYVNLARRNQSLLDRQIGLLDEMEATVEDPDDLGSLFELDHLATRMRRNAESLLVMSGAEQPRQWGSAVPVIDVVRASAAEIADFARVTYFGFEGDVAVVGNAVADVTHLLAELLENATGFSPPESPVVVAGRVVDRRYLITITDEGIAMDDDRLANANALLARPPAPGLALSRTLGLHVVAHLAVRYGIHVQLRRATGTGLSALVAVPATLLARAGEGSEPDVPPPAARPVPQQPVVVETRPSAPASVEPEPAAIDTGRIAWRLGDVAPEGPSPAPTPPPAAPSPAPSPAAAPPPVAPPPEPARAESRPDDGLDDERLTRRVPSGNGGSPVNGSRGNGLTTRVPGSNLSHQPSDAAVSTGDVRPRPERVHDLLSRHERGKRDGRVRAPDTPEAADEP